MRAAAINDSLTFARQQSQRVTRATPSTSIGFHPVPSQIAQAIR
jgi:hypothetical protein